MELRRRPMADTPETYIPITPAKERALWIAMAVLAAVLLALHLWGWAREGRADWVGPLAPLGMLTMAVSNLVGRPRRRLYLLLTVVAVGLMFAGLILLAARKM
jgi:hypothetical protein